MKQERKNEPGPFRWAERLLAWYCRPNLLEDLQGDLNEHFDRHRKRNGLAYARLMYALNVIKFFRWYTIKKPEFIDILIQWIMLGSYIKTSARTIVRSKLFSAINIVGLATSMSVGLLVIAMFSDLSSYDDFHEKKDRIYRVNSSNQYMSERPHALASTSVKAGLAIRETITGVDAITLMRRGFSGDADVNGSKFPITGLWADESFFDVLTFPLVSGSPATALKEPYTLLLTTTSAKRLFGDVNALGKTIRFDTVDYMVTGILKDIPKFSHMTFDVLVSFSTVALQKPDFDGGFLSWENVYSNYVYLVLPKNSDPQILQSKLDQLCARENKQIENRKIMLTLQPLKDIVLGKHLSNPIGPVMPPMALWVFGSLAVIIILSACFNYTNLSIARSLRRSREVGIRKVIGAMKGQVIMQFMVESVIIALLALAFSFLLFLSLGDWFISLSPFLEKLFSLTPTLKLSLYFIALAVAVGIVAGIIPALFFSRINAIQVLKDLSSLRLFRRVTMRKVLIVVQYTFSLFFITSTIIGYSQYKGFLEFDLGYATQNILNISLQGNKSGPIIKRLSELPEATGISQSRIITSIGNLYGTTMKHRLDSSGVWLNYVDEHYLPLHEHVLLAGKNFSGKAANAQESETIVNEQMLKRFDLGTQDPQKALGEIVTMDGKNLAIIGVVQDFHYGTLENRIEPMAFRYSADEPNGSINVKISSTDWPATRTKLEKIWSSIDPVHPLDARFYDDQIEQAYGQFAVMYKLIGFLAVLAVCISSLGLFGMVVFATETRLKEISIRKVLGATEQKLIYLLSSGFLFLLALAAVIAIPTTYFLFDKIVLLNFVYHQPIGLLEIGIGLAGVMIIAFTMIGSQTIKVARSNPANILRSE